MQRGGIPALGGVTIAGEGATEPQHQLVLAIASIVNEESTQIPKVPLISNAKQGRIKQGRV